MIFDFCWFDYEMSQSHLLEHFNKTPEEFKADCKKALAESFEQYMEYIKREGHRWAGIDAWIDFSIDKMKKYGYKHIRPPQWGYFGGMIVRDEFIPEESEESEEFKTSYTKDFPEQIKIMIKHNNELEKEF